jgi:hypothetical protein
MMLGRFIIGCPILFAHGRKVRKLPSCAQEQQDLLETNHKMRLEPDVPSLRLHDTATRIKKFLNTHISQSFCEMWINR